MKMLSWYFCITFFLLAGACLLAASPAAKKIPDFSQSRRNEIPEPYRWKIEDLYPDLEAWRADQAKIRAMMEELEKITPGWTDSSARLLAFFNLYNAIGEKAGRLYAYASLQSDMDLADSQFIKLKGEMQDLLVGFAARTSFIESGILALGEEKTSAWLVAEPGLAPYRFTLEKTLRARPHILPADQQKIVALTRLFSGATAEASTMLNDVDMPKPEVALADGSQVQLTFSRFQLLRASKNPADRRLVCETYWKNQLRFQNTMAALLDGAMKQHLFSAKVRNFPSCLEAALFDDNIEPAVYRNLIRSVRDNLSPLHRLLKLRQRMLGLPELKYGDVYASAVQAVDKTYTYEESREMIQKAMAPLGPDYTAALRQAFEQRWIDLYPNLGKQSGAYSSGIYGAHPYIKMNYNGTFNTVSTLAHELGHAMHSHFSNRTQHHADSQYPTFLAEVASTFNEYLLMRHLLASESDDLFKLFVLDEYLERMRGTLYRQTLFAEFELALHEMAEQGQTLTPDWLNQQYLQLTRDYYGHAQGVMDVEEYIQAEWSAIPHFYMNYYVFQYSTGIVAAMALADQVLQGGEAERGRYLEFLKAGGSRFPLDILRQAGVDMSTPAPVVAALRQMDEMVSEMEKIYTRLQSKGTGK